MIDKSLLRDLVKSVIAEEVATIRKPKAAASAPATVEERIAIANDADLIGFARRVLSLAGDPAKAKEIAAGRYPFRLARPTQAAVAPAPRAASAAPSPAVHSHRIDSGVVTESTLNKLPRGLSQLLLGPGVTVTPLAKDRARALGLTFERMKP
jgi:hypothetical protein